MPEATVELSDTEGLMNSTQEVKMSVEQQERNEKLRMRISRIRTALTTWVPFFGHLLLKLEIRMAEPQMGIATAGVTRDRKLYVNVDFVEKLSDAELAGVLTHEVMHPAFLCWERQGSRVAMAVSQSGARVSLWNMAHDYAINGIIDEMTSGVSSIKLPEGGLINRSKYDGMSAEEIYDDLLQQASNGGKGGKGNGGTVMLPKTPWGMDDMRNDLGDKPGENGDSSGSRSETENRELDNYWKVAVCEAAQIHEQEKGRGTLPGAIKKLVDSIVDPKINWVDALSRWVGENGRRADFTYRRPARRAEALGEILPSIQKHGVDDIVVLWDTSGSMSGREIDILSEVIGICQDLTLSLRVICCDTQVHSDQSEVEDVNDIDVAGGGGSDFNPAFQRLHEEGYSGVVVTFSDGAIAVPEEKPPLIREVLWVRWSNKRDVDPTQGRWGECLHVDKDGNVVSNSKE